MSNLIKENKMREMAAQTDFSYEEIHDVMKFVAPYQIGSILDLTEKDFTIYKIMVERGIV